MPLYEFKCNDCGFKWDDIMPVGEMPKECPKCGSTKIVKVISSSINFKFIGPGFYETDYKNKK